jgi:murein L,D-transpeptidase YcbB/YkuD
MDRTCTQIVTLLLFLVALVTTACQERSGAVVEAPPANAVLRQLVDGKTIESAVSRPHMPASERARLVDQVRRFYQGQNYQLVWIERNRPSHRFAELQKVLNAAADHGLPPELYKVPVAADLSATDKPFSDDQAARFDVTSSTSFFRYFLHLTGGRLDPHALQSLWTLEPKRPDLVAALTEAVKGNDLVAAMQRLQPRQPEYRELQQALVKYRAIAAKGGWPTIPPRTTLKRGQTSEVVPALKQRLAMEGDLDPSYDKDPDTTFGEPLVEALKKFQERHRIKPTGMLTAETVQAVNVPVDERIRTIELNLERWRWLPDPMPERYLIVNVPDFRLEAIEQGRPVMDMRVVVGAPDNKTPIFADEMTQVIFSPYWNVPPGIAEEETIPRAASDPGFLMRNNMEVVTQTGEVVDPYSIDWTNTKGLRIRQRPGGGNALGGVKFIFPNTFDVYLHDTNAAALFNRLERGLSHGCVRVEEPHKLAQYVLRDQPEWTPEAIAAAMKSGEEKHVKLKTPIPVYIVYTTAWVHDGGVRFLKDLYGHDTDQAAKLWPASGDGERPAARKIETHHENQTRR